VACPWLNPKNSPECLALQILLWARYADQDWMKADPEVDCQATHSSQPPVPPACYAEGARTEESNMNGSTNTQPSTPQISSNDQPPAPQPSSDNQTRFEPEHSQDPHFAFPGSDLQEDAEFGPCSENDQPSTNPAVPLTNPMGNEQGVSAASSAPQTSASELSTNTNTYHYYKGKIGRLGHEAHEAINMMIYDGVPYAAIIEKLGEAGKGLKPYHFTRWRKGAHQEWRKERERQHRTQAKQQFAVDALREKDASKLHEAALQIAAGQLSEFLADFDPAVLLEKLQTDPLNFVRLLNTLSKLSESGIKCEAHRIEMAERQVELDKEKSPMKRGLSDETRRYIEREFHLFPEDDDPSANK